MAGEQKTMKQAEAGDQTAVVSERLHPIPSDARTKERLQHLQRLAAALVGAVTTDQVTEAILSEGLTTLRARAGSVCLLSSDGTEIRVARAAGYAQETLEAFACFSVDAPLPIAEAARTRQPVYLNNYGERDARYPHLARYRSDEGKGGAQAALPLLSNGHVLGAMGLNFFPDYTLDADERAFLETITAMCAVALERTGLFDAREETKRLAFLVENCREFVGLCDLNWKPFYINSFGLDLVGLTREEFLQVRVQDCFFPEDLHFLMNDFFPRILHEGQGEVEIRLRHFKTGEPIWIIYSVYVMKDANGEASGYATISRDITERKQAEQAILESEARYRLLFDTNPIGVVEGDLEDGRILQANDAYLEIIGYTREDLEAGRIYWTDLTPPEWLAVDQEQAEKSRETGSSPPYEKEYIRKDGSRVPVMVGFTRLKGNHAVAFVLDIRERKQWETALQEGEERFHAAVEGLHEGLAIMDMHGQFLFCNQSGLRILGLTREQMLGRAAFDSLWRAIHEDGSPFSQETHPVMRALLTGQPVYDVVMGTVRADGEVLWLEINAAPLLRRGEEQPFGVVASFIDITQRRRMEETLRDSEKQIRLLADNAPAVISNVDTQFRFLFVNRAYAERFDMTPEQVVGKTVAEVLGEKAFETLRPYMERAFQGETLSFEALLAYERLGKRYMQVFYAPDIAEDGTVRGLIGVIHDVTARRQMEKERERHLEEIASLNERLRRAMTETHHRVKNNLQVIAALIDLQTLERPEFLPLGEFQRLSQHVSALAAIHDLLTDAARRDGAGDLLDARAVLEKLLPLLQGIAGPDRPLRFAVNSALLTSRQGTSLALVANELVSNAIKHGKGEVEITFTTEDEIARLEVCDDGPGFPPGFDPERAAHTGLDLVQNLTTWDLRGEARYENREQGGARVVVMMALPPGADE